VENRRGAAWGWISYDPGTPSHLLRHQQSKSARAGAAPGLNFWTSAIFARDPETGAAKWAYVFTPHDQWDYDGVNESILVDLPIGGKTRKALVHFDRNAYAYTIDRTTGEVLLATPLCVFELVNRFRPARPAMPIVNPEKAAQTRK
jgi:glucose dehydrogenase